MSWFCSCFAKTYETPEVLELDYRHGSLTEVPADVFSYERTLEKLDLGCNQITDLPPSLFHCHELKELDLCDNELVLVPPAIGTLTKLVKLDLSRNALSDISPTIKSCKNLTYLDLSLNHLLKLPEAISQLVNLEELFLNDTYLEFLNANFGRLTKLRVLELRDNSLQTLPKSMNRLQHLQRIDIGQNDISELPEVIGTMTSLTELWCDNNSIHSLPKFLGNLTKLNCLDASQNDIQELAEEIGKCSQLSDLTLAFNALEALPDSFCKLEQLSVLRLDNNSIQYLPDEFGNLKNLRELSLIRNLLKSVPTSIGLMRKLRTVYVDDNLLTELPKEIGSCAALTILSVAKNRLGEIPSEVGHLSNLKVLTISGNLIVNLPVSLLNIQKLDALWMSESQSKPLPPLNKEVDRTNGKHVLTCYLLPQVPTASSGEIQVGNEQESKPSRRSGTCIKFNTDAEVAPPETSLSKRGLLRAPTPYPKELRALAKHASSLRQKDQNGDVIINDEPEYEGDMLNSQDSTTEDIDIRKNNETRKMHTIGLPSISTTKSTLDQMQMQPLLATTTAIDTVDSNVKSYISENYLPSFRDHSNASASYVSSQNQSSSRNNVDPTSALFPKPGNTQLQPNSVQLLEVNGGKEDHVAGKEPPPYHVAARRAAFFRSVTSSPSGTINGMLPSPTASSTSSYRILPVSRPELDAKPYSEGRPSMSVSALPEASSVIFSKHVASGSMYNSTTTKEENAAQKTSSNTLSSPTASSVSGNFSSEVFSHTEIVEEVVGSNLSEPLPHSPPRRDATFTLPGSKQNPESDTEGRAIQALLLAAQSESKLISKKDENVFPSDNNNFEGAAQEKELVEKLVSNIASYAGSCLQTQAVDSTLVLQSTPMLVDNKEFQVSTSEMNATYQNSVTGNSSIQTVPSDNAGQTNSYVKNIHFDVSEAVHPSLERKEDTKENILIENSHEDLSASNLDPRLADASMSPSLAIESILAVKSPPTRADFELNPSLPPSSDGISTGANRLANYSSESKLPSLRKPLEHRKSDVLCKTPDAHDTPSASSKIPKFGDRVANVNTQDNSRELRRQGDNSKALERTPSGSRIPKFMDKSRTKTRSPELEMNINTTQTEGDNQTVLDDKNITAGIPGNSTSADGNGNSRIPTSTGRKPWIFGTHKNARVVPIEYFKPSDLGFTVATGLPGAGSQVPNGVYIDSVHSPDSAVKIGDKILQVDGIDVSRMSIEIVRKILSNCQENIHLLVSRQY